MMNQAVDIKGLDRLDGFSQAVLLFKTGFGGTQVYRTKRAIKGKEVD